MKMSCRRDDGRIARGAVLLSTAVAVVLTGALGACIRSDRAERECVRKMKMLWSAGNSYRLAHDLPPAAEIDPDDLKGYFSPEDSADLFCPLGTTPYARFTTRDGPRCPNSDAHSRRLRQERRRRAPSGQGVTHE